jgi:hypothetical protein
LQAYRFLYPGVLVGLLLVAGCQKAPMPLFPQAFDLGVQSDGAPFWQWGGVLTHELQFQGLVPWGGCRTRASFETPDGSFLTRFDLMVRLSEQGRYDVTGTYVSAVPFTLTLLGTAPQPGDDVVLTFDAGEGTIQYEGAEPFTYQAKVPAD